MVALMGAFGVMVLVIRNTADKTLMNKMRPTVLVMGNTTQLGIDLLNYMADRSVKNAQKVRHSASIVMSFTFDVSSGVGLYMGLGFWAVGSFIIPIVYLAIEAGDDALLENMDWMCKTTYFHIRIQHKNATRIFMVLRIFNFSGGLYYENDLSCSEFSWQC